MTRPGKRMNNEAQRDEPTRAAARTFTLFALSLYPSETLAWTGLAGWGLRDGQLTMRRSNGEVERLNLPRKYIGLYQKHEQAS